MTSELSPYDAPELYDFIFERFDFDLAFWMRVARDAKGPVLDVGCGSGRVLLRLLEAGLDADGLDASKPMIDHLHAKAAERGLKPVAHVADMRDFTMPRRYALAFLAFNAFAHCETTDDQIRTLRCCREHLESGGALVIHMSYPDPKYWSEPDGAVMEMETTIPDEGRKLQLWDNRTKDVVTQSQKSLIEIREIGEDGTVALTHRSATSQRWVYRYEMELLLRVAGFSRWEIRGDFGDEPLVEPGQQMLAWAWRD